jgi:hypothetical protein
MRSFGSLTAPVGSKVCVGSIFASDREVAAAVASSTIYVSLALNMGIVTVRTFVAPVEGLRGSSLTLLSRDRLLTSRLVLSGCGGGGVAVDEL